jgi:hypothetical protein
MKREKRFVVGGGGGGGGGMEECSTAFRYGTYQRQEIKYLNKQFTVKSCTQHLKTEARDFQPLFLKLTTG